MNATERSAHRSLEPAPQRHAGRPRPRGRSRLARQGEPSLKVLAEEGYVASYRRVEEKGRPVLRVGLKYDARGRADRRRPRARLAARAAGSTRRPRRSPRSWAASAISIVSTSKGIVTGRTGARAQPRRRGPLQRLVSGEEEKTPCHASEECRSRSRKGVEVKRGRGRPSASRGPRASCRAAIPPGLTVVDRRAARSGSPARATSRSERAVPRPPAQPRRQHRRGRHEGLHQGARDRRRRLQGRGQGQAIVFSLGYSHPVELPDPGGDRDRARRQGGQAHGHRRRPAEGRPDGGRDPQAPRCPTRTRPRASSTPTRSSGARSARRAGSRP